MPSSPLLSAGTSLALANEVAQLLAGMHAQFGVDGADVGAHGVDGQRLKSVPAAATNPLATTNAGCVTAFRRRDAHAAAKTSATVEAMRCTMMRFSARRLFSMSCTTDAAASGAFSHLVCTRRLVGAPVFKSLLMTASLATKQGAACAICSINLS